MLMLNQSLNLGLVAILLAPHHAYSGGNVSIIRAINVAEDTYLDSNEVPPKFYNDGGSTTLTFMSNNIKQILLRTNLQRIIHTGSNTHAGNK
jgi:hypothetical protein